MDPQHSQGPGPGSGNNQEEDSEEDRKSIQGTTWKRTFRRTRERTQGRTLRRTLPGLEEGPCSIFKYASLRLLHALPISYQPLLNTPRLQPSRVNYNSQLKINVKDPITPHTRLFDLRADHCPPFFCILFYICKLDWLQFLDGLLKSAGLPFL